MRSVTLHIITLFALLLTLAACSDECTDNKNALPLAGFYSVSAPQTQVYLQGVEVYGIGAPGDSIISEGAVSKDMVYLPFRIDSDTTAYAFRYSEAEGSLLPDTITFIYTRQPRFASAACGVSYLFEMRDIKYTRHLIDSVACPKGYIDNANIENLEIFFRVSPIDS